MRPTGSDVNSPLRRQPGGLIICGWHCCSVAVSSEFGEIVLHPATIGNQTAEGGEYEGLMAVTGIVSIACSLSASRCRLRARVQVARWPP